MLPRLEVRFGLLLLSLLSPLSPASDVHLSSDNDFERTPGGDDLNVLTPAVGDDGRDSICRVEQPSVCPLQPLVPECLTELEPNHGSKS